MRGIAFLLAVPGILGLSKALANGDELPSHLLSIVDGTGSELLGSELDGLVLEDNFAGLAVSLLDLVGVHLQALLVIVHVCLCNKRCEGERLV